MKVSKSLKHSVLGICCSLGLSGFAYSQGPFESILVPALPAPPGQEFAPTINIDDDINVSIVATNDNPMRVTISLGALSQLQYRIQVFEPSTFDTLYDVTRDIVDADMGQQINNLSITTGRGSDGVSIFSGDPIEVTGDLTIDMRNGDDSVSVSNVNVGGRTSIRGRAGTDSMFVRRLSADSLYIGGGPGDSDGVTISDSVIINRVSFSGGRGSGDLIDASGNDFRQTPRVVNFESVAD